MFLTTKRRRLYLALLAILGASTPSGAAIRNATSCSRAAVQAAVDSAVSGDIVVVPAGSCTYTAAVSIPNGKNITIQGAGINITTISSAGMTQVFHLNNTASRITEFTFNGGQIATGEDEGTGSVANNDWRIDHNRFIGFGGFHESILVQCSQSFVAAGLHCRGLIDNNVFENGAFAKPLGFKATVDLHATWNRATDLGSQNTVFIENNTFSFPTDQLPHMVDTNYGGRFVVRFNTITGMAVEIHSLQQWRATRAWEVYKNTFNFPGGGWTIGLIRGGTGVVWGNTETGSSPEWVLDNVRSFNSGYDYGNCNGGSTADGNTAGQQGWPCRDQIGRGRDSCLSNPSNLGASATGWCAQASEPAYFWLNRTAIKTIVGIDTAGRGLSTTHHVLANRDFFNELTSFTGASGVGSGTLANRPATCTIGVAYWATDQGEWNSLQSGPDGQLYKCTSTNTWTLYYKPYTYPHPHTIEGDTPPLAPANPRIVRP
jgi:hypothetical protein